MENAAQPGFSTDLDEAFRGTEVPAIPVPQSHTVPSYVGVSDFMSGLGNMNWGSTLDEEVYVTLMRDVRRVADNVKLVLMPRYSTDKTASLRDWDLWGPFFFVLLLASLLAMGSSAPSQMFSVVFCLLTAGALVLTLNIILLGGKIMFFQSLSLIGYCLFPLDIAALLCLFWSNAFWRVSVLMFGVGWSIYASVPFVGSSVPPARHALAVYPIFLLFITIAWFTLITH
mmetsp:Transcript_37807/g.52494  ORF Transcript_37807/g.52494 Transcript_37807/m.52494 type:complete len:228 (-) Transcript_37807:247-930(-)